MYNSHHLIKHNVVIYRTLQYYILQIKNIVFIIAMQTPQQHTTPLIFLMTFSMVHTIYKDIVLT